MKISLQEIINYKEYWASELNDLDKSAYLKKFTLVDEDSENPSVLLQLEGKNYSIDFQLWASSRYSIIAVDAKTNLEHINIDQDFEFFNEPNSAIEFILHLIK